MTTGGAGGRERAPAPVTGPPRRSRAPRSPLPPGSSPSLAVLCVVAGACGASTGRLGCVGREHHGPGPRARPRWSPSRAARSRWRSTRCPTTLNDHTVAGDTPAGRMLASAVWAQVFRVGPGLTPQLDTNVVDSAEVVSLQPQTVVYQIDPRAVWSDGVPISADDFAYAWQSQKGGAIDVDGSPDSVASTLGYRDIDSLTGSNGGQDRHGGVPHALRRLGVALRRPPARPHRPDGWGGTTGSTTSTPPCSCRAVPGKWCRGSPAPRSSWGATRGGGGARPRSTGSWCGPSPVTRR